MGPKKDKVKDQLKTQKCTFHDRGYCKHGEKCRNIHFDKVCEDQNCFNINCEKRHPNPCKFGIRCTFERKNICLYSHVTTASADINMKALENKVSKKFEVLENKFTEKFALFESQINNLRKDLDIKDKHIMSLETKIENMVKEEQVYKKLQEKTIKDVENSFKLKKSKEKTSVTNVPEDLVKCDHCDFTSTTKQGLKIHNTRVHSTIDFSKFPAACDVCGKVLENENKLKKHKKSEHTYHAVKFQCNECEFMANEIETLDVHFGRKHSDKKQCGLCDKTFGSSKDLDNHLSKCEIYMCSNSGCKKMFEQVNDMKEHINTEHKQKSPAHYSFHYWYIHAKNNCENEIYKNLLRINPADW